MSVDQASALEDTLTRLRQRYALHFYLPEGSRAGQERQVSVDLSAAARRRYPDAEVRHRRSYVAPASNDSSPAEVTSNTPGAQSPAVADASPEPTGTTAPARPRRRVSDANSGSGSGPLIDRSSDDSATQQGSSGAGGGWPKADNGSANPAPKTPAGPGQTTATPAEKRGGWPRAK